MHPEIKFVLGFAVNEDVSEVLLIQKKRGPSFNIGKWNGIGGKIEVGEGIRSAMAREFEEECGITTSPTSWTEFHQETHRARAEQTLNPRLYCMTTKIENWLFNNYRSATDERVERFHLQSNTAALYASGVYNLEYLLAMVRCWHAYPDHQWIEG